MKSFVSISDSILADNGDWSVNIMKKGQTVKSVPF